METGDARQKDDAEEAVGMHFMCINGVCLCMQLCMIV